VTAKPTVSELGIDLAAQVWHRSGRGDGVIEVAFARTGNSAEWVLMRVAGDPDQRVLVFDRHEWECFLDGARNGEFDDAVAAPSPLGATTTSHPYGVHQHLDLRITSWVPCKAR
jgi:Domain of unknown function (DUF397)